MEHSKDIVKIAYEHLSKVTDVKGILLCCIIYGKWMSFADEVAYIEWCDQKIRSILNEKKEGD